MPAIHTRDYGLLSYAEEDVLDFPRGIPGFPGYHRFLTLCPRPAESFIVLQSLDLPELAFLTLPVSLLDPRYQIRMIAEDRQVLGTDPSCWRALTILSLPADAEPTVNLLGPIVIDPTVRRAVQAIRDDTRYRADESLESWLTLTDTVAASEESVCS